MKQMARPSIERYREVLEYRDGALYWRVRLSSRNAPGSLAGCRSGDAGYCLISVDRHTTSAHQIVWAIHNGEWPPEGRQVDHINGDRLDNRIDNLRLVDITQQACNKKVRKNNSLGVKGVCWDASRGRYKAQLDFQRKHYNIGHFDTIEEASQAYQALADQLHGEYQRKVA